MTFSAKTGILLINLGTPNSPETADVRKYLREFLYDPRVLDIHPIGRWFLVHGIIAPFRAPKSAQAYQKIWTEEGSPLLFHSQHLLQALRVKLPEIPIELAMRYQNPSIAAGLTSLAQQGCNRLILCPLYPQYAASSTGSSLEQIYRESAKLWNTPYFSVLPAFYDHPQFIAAFAAIGRPILDQCNADHVLFSFHGLPVRHLEKSGPNHCKADEQCCLTISAANRDCYRAQCFETARLLRDALHLDSTTSTICFQSRLGTTPWIQPYTDEIIPQLASKGVKSLAVFCPAFVADCLETLEEIGMRAKADFIAAGGESLTLVPSLNDHPAWVQALATMLAEMIPKSNSTPLTIEAHPS